MRNLKLISIFFICAWISCDNADSNNGYSYTKWRVDSQGNKIRKSEFKCFDNQDNLIKWIQYLDDGQSMTDSFSYVFKGGSKIEEYRYKSNGQLWNKTIFIYGENNKLKETKSYDRDNKQESATRHKSINKMEIVENYSSEGELYSIDTLIYNDKDKILLEAQYLSEGEWFQKHRYEYDLKGNLIVQQSQANPDFDGIGIVEYRYENNENNRPLRVTVIFPDESKEYYIYEYDNY
jgi:hypothetical protein